MIAQPIKSPGQARAAWPFYSIGFEDVQTTVAFVRNRVLIATAIALLIALIGGLLIATRLGRRVGGLERAARSVARRALGGAAARDLEGRDRPAHRDLQPDAAAAPERGHRAEGVHRHRLARAAHAHLLARRLRGAAAGRGPRRGHPARVPRDDGRAGGAAAEAVRGPARPVAARLRLRGAAHRAGRPRGAHALRRRRVPPAAHRARNGPDAGRPGRRARARSATGNGSLRSCVSCSTTPSATPRRART